MTAAKRVSSDNKRVWRRYLSAMGPGLVTGASDDDPSGIATYSQAGAQYGYGLLWLTLITFPLMFAVQEICDRTALATGKNLGVLASEKFAKTGRTLIGILLVALMAANALNVAADLVAIGAGMNLLHAGPAALWALIAGAAITALLIAGSFETVARVFKYLCLALLSYVVVLFVLKVDWGDAAKGFFIPHPEFSRAYIGLLVAVLGTTISPYLFFWQSAHRVEELREEPEGADKPVALKQRTRHKAKEKLSTSRLDVFSGMLLSQVVMFAVIVATAATLHQKGITTVSSSAQAASALTPIAGSASTWLFALGFIGSGFLAVPVLAGSGSAGMAGLLGKGWGFSRSPRKAPAFYGLVVVGTIGGAALTLLPINPISLLIVSAGVNGFAAAPFLVIVMLISGNRQVMGKYVNGRLATSVGWFTVGVMAAAAIALIATT